jgi:hypothetical protein
VTIAATVLAILQATGCVRKRLDSFRDTPDADVPLAGVAMKPLCRIALLAAIAAQSLPSLVTRLTGEHAEAAAALLQRANNAVVTSPRWGHSLERVASVVNRQTVANPRSSP